MTVADDGGSSGVLRDGAGIPAVGDIRNCIVALADAEPLMGRLLQYRFPGRGARGPPRSPDVPPSRDAEALSVGLGGHAIGNLLLAALVELEDGDFEEARARDEPRPRRARPGRPGDGDAADAPRPPR